MVKKLVEFVMVKYHTEKQEDPPSDQRPIISSEHTPAEWNSLPSSGSEVS